MHFRLRGSSRGATLILALTLLAGCAAKRDAYVVPEVPIPNQFRQSLAPVAEPAPAAPREDSPDANIKFVDELLAEWWRILGSKELDALMDQLIANNADLRIATLRIVQAKARSEQARADEFPVVTVPYEARIEAPAGGVGSVASGQEVAARRLYQGSLRGDWRLDVWGERRALTESSQMQLWRSIYQRDDTRRAVVASLVSQYVEYLSLNDRLRVARETEIVLRGMLDAVAGRLKGGDATITELEQQRAAVYSVQATIPALELQRENAINSLAQLLGATPGSLALSHRGMDSILFPRVLPGVPANMLLRRPDVRAIEARLLAADADIDVARTRLLPSIDLTSQLGYGSLVFSRLLQPHNLAWNAIASLSATIFDYGKRTNEVVFARALHEELVETYVRVLYSAIRETEDAIATVQMNGKRLEAQGAAARAAKRAWDLSIESYREGAIDYLTLLDTERTYHRNLDEYHRVAMERHKGLVSLFSALGGGIPKNSPRPSRGDPPADAIGGDHATRTAARLPIQFFPHVAEGDKDRPFWLVEIAGLQDRVGVTHVWLDLMHRFPDLMSDRVILPRLQGRVASEREEKTAWYRIFIARFSTAQSAKDLCDRLSAALVRCRALASDSPAYQEFMDSAVTEASRASQVPVAAAETISLQTDSLQTQRAATRTRRGATMSMLPLHTLPPELTANRAPADAASSSAAEPPSLRPALPLPQRPATAPSELLHTRLGAVANAPPGPESGTPEERKFEKAAPTARIGYAVQLATLFKDADAETSSRYWSRKGYKTYVYPVLDAQGNAQYTVRTGVYASQEQAAGQAAAIRRNEQTFAVPVPVTLDEAGQPTPSIARR